MKSDFLKTKCRNGLRWLWRKLSREKRRNLKPFLLAGKKRFTRLCYGSSGNCYKQRMRYVCLHPLQTIQSVCRVSVNVVCPERRKRQKSEIQLLKSSGFFDENFYLESYPDVRLYGGSPASHYYYYGWKEGRIPHAHCDSSFFSMLIQTGNEQDGSFQDS